MFLSDEHLMTSNSPKSTNLVPLSLTLLAVLHLKGQTFYSYFNCTKTCGIYNYFIFPSNIYPATQQMYNRFIKRHISMRLNHNMSHFVSWGMNYEGKTEIYSAHHSLSTALISPFPNNSFDHIGNNAEEI